MANTTVTTEASFIPEIWANEVIAVQENNLVMASSVKRIDFMGRKGDTYNIPKANRQDAVLKVADTPVSFLSTTATLLPILVNRHFVFPKLYEDIAELQALDSMRQFFTADAGYALAKVVDTDLHSVGATLDGGTAYSNAVIGGDGTTAYTDGTPNATAITRAGFVEASRLLDDADVPMNDRTLVIPPVAKATMLQINEFNSSDFVNGSPTSTGMFGRLYSTDVKVSTNCATMGATTVRACLLLHKDAMALVEQMGVKVTADYENKDVGTSVVAQRVYGFSQWQDNHAVAIAVPA